MIQFDVGTIVVIDNVEYEVYDMVSELGMSRPTAYCLIGISEIGRASCRERV